MLDGHLLIDAHVHAPRLPTLKLSWQQWTRGTVEPGVRERVYDPAGTVRPAELDALFAEQGVDIAVLLCEYSPRVTGMSPIEDLLPIVAGNPQRFRLMAAVNPYVHWPVRQEVTRQLDLGAVALKIHPAHGAFRADDAALYPAYEVCRERGVPVVMHCGTSTFPGAVSSYADPASLDPVAADFPEVDFVLAHGGRGWWYDAAAFMTQLHPNVWIELSGLPPRRLPDYYARFDLARLAQKWIFGTDWPAVPGIARNARGVAELGLPDDVLGLVLGGNAVQVYGLDGVPGRSDPQ